MFYGEIWVVCYDSNWDWTNDYVMPKKQEQILQTNIWEFE